MDITTDIKTVTYLKSRAAELLNDLNENRRPIIITQNGEPQAVLQDPESYMEMQRAIAMLRLVAEGEKDFREGRTKTHDEVYNRIKASLEAE